MTGGRGRGAVPPLVAGIVIALAVGLAALPLPAAVPSRIASLPLPEMATAILLALALPRGGPAAAFARATLAGGLVLALVWRLADAGMASAFARPFDPLTDLPLLRSGVDLLRGSVGAVPAAGAVAGAALALLTVAATLVWALRRLAGRGPRRAVLPLAALAVLWTAAAYWLPALPGHAPLTQLVLDRAARLERGVQDRRDFARAAATDAWAGRTGALDRLGGADLIVVFVESYGRNSLDAPLYAATHRATLAEAEPVLSRAGLAMRSGWLTSPISGGQSWLAHATLAAGLKIDTQGRYGALLAAPGRTLWHIAAGAGRPTLAIAPAITLPWPEGPRLGFGQVLAAADLDYHGAAFNWVTMPDQFTLSRLGQVLDGAAGPQAVEVALISSHAPWVPVPRPVPWQAVGNGEIFTPMTEGAPSPEQVWADPDRVRAQYRQAIDYSLRIVFDYAAQPRRRPALLLVLGDHPPAPFVAQMPGRDVPAHLLGPPDLVALAADWGWTNGLIPATSAASLPMEAFRDRFLGTYTTQGGTTASDDEER